MDKTLYKKFHEIQSLHWWFQARKDIILTILNRHVNDYQKVLLDIGCGCGLFLESLADDYQTYGVDFSEDAIKFTRELTNSQTSIGTLPDGINYSEGVFDIVLALDVIEHINDDVSSIKTINKLLKKDGIAIITVPAFQFLWTAHDEINHHKRRYRLSQLLSLVESSKFEVMQASYYNCLLFPFLGSVRLVQRLTSANANDNLNLPPKWLNKLLKNIFACERFLLEKVNLPFGLSIIMVLKKK